MRFGVCIGTDMTLLAKLKEYGYDFAEFGLSSIADWDDAQVEAARAAMEETGIWGEACNGFFASFQRGYLSSDEVDFSSLESYIRRALAKAHGLGLQVAVIGSGAARTILDETRRAQGEAQFARVLRLAGDIAAEYGVKIVIEPLNAKETNLINTVEQGAAMCRLVNHSNVFVLADFFHVFMSGEGMQGICQSGELLQHVHIARGNIDRCVPIQPEDQADCAVWAAALRKNGYDGRISLESIFSEDWDDDVSKMRNVLRVFE